jgi:Na+/proline symporter
MSEYFVGGRSLPWWLAGTSMVATTFAADTPLAVTELVVKYGVAGNWLWWNMVMSGILTVFFYARLWRRAGVHHRRRADRAALRRQARGRAARVPRGLPRDPDQPDRDGVGERRPWPAILGTVLDINRFAALVVCFVVTARTRRSPGILGVIWTDFFQFILAMVGCIVLAVFAVDAVGGLEALQMKLAGPFGSTAAALAFLPATARSGCPGITMATYLGVNWWASWYPGAEPGGGGYIAQRIFSARTSATGLLATLWFNVAHYAVRPWPWILVALREHGALPGARDPEAGLHPWRW